MEYFMINVEKNGYLTNNQETLSLKKAKDYKS